MKRPFRFSKQNTNIRFNTSCDNYYGFRHLTYYKTSRILLELKN